MQNQLSYLVNVVRSRRARPNLGQTGLLLALGAVGSLGLALWIESLRRAQASLLAPLEYSMFAYAVFWGWLVFGDPPTARTMIGAAIILTAGLMTVGVGSRRDRIAEPEAPQRALSAPLPKRRGLG